MYLVNYPTGKNLQNVDEQPPSEQFMWSKFISTCLFFTLTTIHFLLRSSQVSSSNPWTLSLVSFLASLADPSYSISSNHLHHGGGGGG